jgi:hypothetical protein
MIICFFVFSIKHDALGLCPMAAARWRASSTARGGTVASRTTTSSARSMIALTLWSTGIRPIEFTPDGQQAAAQAARQRRRWRCVGEGEEGEAHESVEATSIDRRGSNRRATKRTKRYADDDDNDNDDNDPDQVDDKIEFIDDDDDNDDFDEARKRQRRRRRSHNHSNRANAQRDGQQQQQQQLDGGGDDVGDTTQGSTCTITFG